MRNIPAAIQRNLTTGSLHRIHGSLRSAAHLRIGTVSLVISGLCLVSRLCLRLVSGCHISLAVRSLGNIAAGRCLASGIRIAGSCCGRIRLVSCLLRIRLRGLVSGLGLSLSVCLRLVTGLCEGSLADVCRFSGSRGGLSARDLGCLVASRSRRSGHLRDSLVLEVSALPGIALRLRISLGLCIAGRCLLSLR